MKGETRQTVDAMFTLHVHVKKCQEVGLATGMLGHRSAGERRSRNRSTNKQKELEGQALSPILGIPGKETT